MKKAKDVIRRKEVHLPDSVLERLALLASKKKWSLKRFMEQVLTDKVKPKKTVLVFGNDQIELK